MGLLYSHLSLHERQLMFNWHHYHSIPIREIARRLGRSHSTISRELKRNISSYYVPTWYPHLAQSMYERKMRVRAQRENLKSSNTQGYVIEKLKIGWTPELISGRLKHHETLPYVCHETIYQYIYKEAPELISCLARKHKKRKKKYPARKYKQAINNKTSILERPEIINDRLEFGHWESDSIISAGQKPGCNVVIERCTRMVHITKLNAKTAEETEKALVNKLIHHPCDFVKSITYDNGTENSNHLKTNDQLKCDSFFCQAYHSWEKGAVEQVNGLIRRFLPKKTDITQIPDKKILEIEHILNSRPRKCLNYRTPLEVYEQYRKDLPISSA